MGLGFRILKVMGFGFRIQGLGARASLPAYTPSPCLKRA